MAKPITRDDFKPIRSRRYFRFGKKALIPLIFLAFVAMLCMIGKLPWFVLMGYVATSATTFGYYFFDKSAAQMGRWRTPEKTLHMLALIGGWPGAMLAQEYIRHKSSKTSFLVAFWATVLINCGLLAWILTKSPQEIEKILSRLAMLKNLI